MTTEKKDPARLAKEKLLRYLQSKAYPVIHLQSEGETIMPEDMQEESSPLNQMKTPGNTKDVFIRQLKQTLKDPCIFVHLPEEDSPDT